MTDLIQNTEKTFLDLIREKNERDRALGEKSILDETRQFIEFVETRDIREPGTALEEYAAELERLVKEGTIGVSTFNKRLYAARKRVGQLVEDLETMGTVSVEQIRLIEKRLDKIKQKRMKRDPAIDSSQVLTREEQRQLLDGTTDKTIKLIIETLLNTGLRISELLNITLSNINPNGKVVIRIVGKGNKERKVQIPKQLYTRIRDHFQGEKYLFEHNGRKYNRNSVTQRIKMAALKTLGRDISAHTLRHTFATYLLNEEGYSLKKVSKMLGHSSIQVTADIYQEVMLTSEDWEGAFITQDE